MYTHGKRLLATLFLGVLLFNAISPAASAAATPQVSAPIDIQRHPAGTAIYTLMVHGILKGYPDGRYHPDQPITVEEATVVIYTLSQALAPEPVPTPEPTPTPAPSTVPTPEVLPTPTAAPEPDPTPEALPTPTVAPEPEQQALAVTSSASPDMSSAASLTAPTPNVTPILISTPYPSVALTPSPSPDPTPIPTQKATPAPTPAPTPSPIIPALSGRWSSQALQALAVPKIVLPRWDGAYHLTSPITRAEIAGVLYRAGYQRLFSLPAIGTAPSFSDVSQTTFNGPAILELCARGILSGQSDGAFHPNDPLTRAELATICFKISGFTPITPPRTLPEQSIIPVPYFSQVYPYQAWVGCEPTCLYMALRYRGCALEVNLKQFLDRLPKDSCNPARGFVGSPYRSSTTLRTTIYPPVLAAYGRTYGAKAEDFSGASISELQDEVLAGNPVVAYVTLWWAKPYYRSYMIDGASQSLIYNNHAVLVTGYDCTANRYYITDPYNVKAADRKADYRYWIDASTFDPLYNVRQHAIVIR